MSYIGNPPAEAYTNTVKDSFSGDGSTVAFTLSRPSLTNDVRVVVENVIQDPTVAYSVSGTTLTFTSAPPSGTNNIYVVHLGPAVQTAVPPGEISAATTFASNVTVQGDLLAGKNTSSITTDGWRLTSGGSHYAIPSGQYFIFNRTTSGAATIVDFRSENSSKGSINFNGTNISYTSGANNVFNQAGISFDNGANYLDDYEEGSWSPTLSGGAGAPTVTYSLQTGRYTKVGNKVTLWFIVNPATCSGGTGTAIIQGLPFAPSSSAVYSQHPVLVDNIAADRKQVTLQIEPSNNFIPLIGGGGSTGAHFGVPITDFNGGETIRGTVTYEV